MRLPSDTAGYLHQEILRNARYLLITVDKCGLITKQDCPGSYWRMEGVKTGRKLPDDLHGIIEASAGATTPQLFPYVQLTNTLVADVHVLRNEEETHLILRDVSESHDVECKLQQKAREISLLQEQTEELNHELVERRLEAEQANQARTRFIAAMSHEFRSPINSIMGNAKMLNDTLPGIAGAAAIQRASWHLLTLVENLLEQAQNGEGILRLTIAPVEVAEVFNDMRELFDVQVQSRGLEFKLHSPPETSAFLSDENRLRQVMINLISNAIRYTDTGEVRVDCISQGGSLRFAIADTGKGIAKHDQERVFKPFNRVSASGGGAGLGLTISQQLVNALGGKLELESELGAGSTFSFSLPMNSAVNGKSEGDLSGVSILLVEDDNDLREMYKVFLEDWGMQVTAVPGYQSAMKAFTTHPTDIIMSDFRLGDGFGNKLLNKLHKIRPESGTVLCSGGMEDGNQIDENCADHFIVKPISAAYLKSIILKTVNKEDS